MGTASTSGGTVNVAVVGAGGICNSVHMPSLKLMPDVNVVAICDLIPERAEKTAAKWGIPHHYTLMREMFANEKIDAVMNLVEPASLFHVSMLSLEHGYHTLSEKPPALLSTQAEALARKSDETGKIMMAAFNRRYIPAVRKVFEALKGIEITQVEGCFYKYGSGDRFDKGGISAFLSDTVHAVDLLRALSGGGIATKAALIGKSRECCMENIWNGLFEFDNGVTGIIKANYIAGGRTHRFEAHGIGISAYMNLGIAGEPHAESDISSHTDMVSYSMAAAGGKASGMVHYDSRDLAESQDYFKYYGYYYEDRHFIDCVKAGTMPETCIQDARLSVRLTEQLLQSRM